MSRRFGTEGSVVQIHSPRPIPQKSSEICRVQSGSSLGFDAQIESREPSALNFKRWPSEELFDISSGASLVAGSVAHSSAQRSDSNLYAHLMLIAPTGGLRRSSTSTRARLESGAVVKIDLETAEVVEVAGEISDRDIKRAERLVARDS